jgi:hypothetical protein
MACDIINDQARTTQPVMTTSVARSASGSIVAKRATIENAMKCITAAKPSMAKATIRARRGLPAVSIDHQSRQASRSS